MPNPRFPIYIPSKGRADRQLTSRALTRRNVPHTIVVEPEERDEYEAKAWPAATFLTLDPTYKDRYQYLDDLGRTKPTGSGPARNFIWDTAAATGPWHWIMDDNIKDFFRLNRNRKIRTGDGTGFAVMEDFTLRYRNVAMSGPTYLTFANRKGTNPPFITNTRIYSCNLIRNDLPYRWRGRYNEDVILSLDMLKAGWCTIEFYAFLQEKTATQREAGGNTAEFYAREGTGPKSEMLVRTHPDVARLAMRWNRIHHHVNYNGFTQPLIRRPNAHIPTGINDYGMTIRPVDRDARKQAEAARGTQTHTRAKASR